MPDSLEKAQHEPQDIPEDDDHSSFWVKWKHEIVSPNEINWRDEFLNAKPDEGDAIDANEVSLTVPACKLPRDMIKEDMAEHWAGVSKAGVKESVG